MTKPVKPGPGLDDFRFFERLRVRWSEVDMQKIVFNGHYLMYFDTAVAAYWRALAMPYEQTMVQLQGDLFVRKATLEYEGSARYDDECVVGMQCTRLGSSSLTFTAAVFRGEQRLVHGELVYVFADASTQTSRPVPPALRAALAAFEAGKPMLEYRLGDGCVLGPSTQAVQPEVDRRELQIPAELAAHIADQQGLQVVAVNRFGLAVAIARLLPSGPRVAALSCVAVIGPLRGSGIGRAVLQALMQAALQRGVTELRLKAPRSTVGFFLRAGFALDGEPFDESGMPHQRLGISLG